MRLFDETLDPSETKDYTFDWSSALAAGEAITSHAVAIINAAGATNPSNSLAGTVSRVWLTGGVSGSRVVFTITVSTSQGRTLEEAFGVNVLDSTIFSDPAPSAEDILTRLAEAKEQRHLVAMGKAVVEVWRNGRRVQVKVTDLKQLNDYIQVLEREYAEQLAVDAGKNRRRPISLAWMN